MAALSHRGRPAGGGGLFLLHGGRPACSLGLGRARHRGRWRRSRSCLLRLLGGSCGDGLCGGLRLFLLLLALGERRVVDGLLLRPLLVGRGDALLLLFLQLGLELRGLLGSQLWSGARAELSNHCPFWNVVRKQLAGKLERTRAMFGAWVARSDGGLTMALAALASCVLFRSSASDSISIFSRSSASVCN